MKNNILIPIILILLISCTQQEISQEKYRNQNYIWFIENGETQGEWIKSDDYDDKNFAKNGHCTAFYKNGTIREKYSLDILGRMDTIYYYNLKEKLTHYSFNSDSKNLENVFVIDGEFKAYSPNETLVLSGFIVDDSLKDYQFHGDVKLFYFLMENSTNDWNNFSKLLQSITKVVKERSKSNALKIPIKELDKIDSLRVQSLRLTDKNLSDIESLKSTKNTEDLKATTIDFININKGILENEMINLFEKMKLEFTNENINSMRELTIDILDKTKASEKELEKEQINFKRKQQLGEYLLPFFKERIENQ